MKSVKEDDGQNQRRELPKTDTYKAGIASNNKLEPYVLRTPSQKPL